MFPLLAENPEFKARLAEFIRDYVKDEFKTNLQMATDMSVVVFLAIQHGQKVERYNISGALETN